MNQDASYIQHQEKGRVKKIAELVERLRVSTCPTEREILDQQLESAVAELDDWLELVVSMRQQ